MSFKNIYGHNKNIDFYKSIIRDNRLSHSYIFNGVEGIGKKLFSTNLSKAILCKELKEDACEKCTSCKKINHGNHPDLIILEPDGKSIKNRQIKEFQEFLSYMPNESEKKIVIINDSNTMTTSAQNTILKILEEPPSYALIILITSNLNSLLDTIKSRCQIINFNKLDIDIVNDFLINEYDLKKEDANAIALFSNGIIKKASLAYENDKFLDLREKVIEFSNYILFNDKIKVLSNLNFLIDEKESIDLIFQIMTSWLRDILIVQSTNNYDIVINKDKEELIKKISYRVVDRNIVDIIDKINKTIKDLNRNVNYKLAIDYLILNIIEVGGS